MKKNAMAPKRYLSICLISVIQLVICLAFPAEACDKNEKVDYIRLAMTWQPGACKSGVVRCESWSNKFSIHGLWPQKNYGRLENCCTKEVYYEKRVEAIRGSLKAHWPTLTPGREDAAWQYQFNKHGSCAIGKVAGVKNPQDYFKLAINEFKIFDLLKVLQDGEFKVLTNTKYYGSDILDYLREVFGYRFQLVCNSKYVVEIRACFDTNMNQIDCYNTSSVCKDLLTFQ